jgi:molybdate transport system substrate-binding protein
MEVDSRADPIRALPRRAFYPVRYSDAPWSFLMIRKMLASLLLLCAASTGTGAERALTVFGAASLTNVLQEIGTAYTAESQVPVRFSFAASSALARQIESGSPADVFVSADQDWMDYLQERNLLAPVTRVNVVSNSLVLIAPADSTVKLHVSSGFKLADALGANGRLATGDPTAVPVGRYAQAALTNLGVWSSVEKRIVGADNVRTALNFVARGEAPLGIVYATDARSEPKVKVLDTFPASSHEPITYPAAATSIGGDEGAKFVVFLNGVKARAIFDNAGFGRP